LLVKAALQRGEGRTLEALRTLERVLRERGAGAALKCEALFCMGELHHSIGEPNLALPYLQRVYVSYGGFQPWAAKAYLASAEAFTAIGKHQSARNTYNELLASGLAPDAPERAIASSKLKALGGTP
jgi:tetratricopeptide (TPR) repeat protein